MIIIIPQAYIKTTTSCHTTADDQAETLEFGGVDLITPTYLGVTPVFV